MYFQLQKQKEAHDIALSMYLTVLHFIASEC